MVKSMAPFSLKGSGLDTVIQPFLDSSWFIPEFIVVLELNFHTQIGVVSITPSRLSSSNLE